MFKFNELSKWEKAGLIIGGLECVAGFGMAIYANVAYKKELNRIQESVKEINKDANEKMNTLVHEE